MGAWGSGSFENDAAMDWAADVQSIEDVQKPFERLKRDTDAHGVDQYRVWQEEGVGCGSMKAWSVAEYITHAK